MKQLGLIALLALSMMAVSCKSLRKKPQINANTELSNPLKETYYNAEAAFEANQLKEAKELFLSFADKSPLPAAGYYRLACISKAEKDKDGAFTWIDKAINADSNNYYYSLFKATLNEEKRDFTGAGFIYYKLALKYPTHWSFFSDAAKMFQRSRSYESTVALCNEWEKAFGLKEEIVKYRCLAWEQQKEFGKVAADWERMATKYPYRREYKLNWAAALQQSGNADQAASIYATLLAEDPENPELLSALCGYYQTAGDKAQLWKHANKVVLSHQMDVWRKHQCLLPFLNNMEGNVYYDSLENLLITMTQINGDDHRSWLFLADWYYARKDYLKAIGGFGKTLQLFNNDFQVWSKYAECLDRTASFQKLAAVADSMLELFPLNPTVYLISATAYRGLEDWSKAKEAIENGNIYAVDGDIVLALRLSLAHILNSSGKKDEAYRLMQDIYTKNANQPDVLNTMAELYATNNENLDACVNWIEQAIKLNGRKADYFYTKALILMKKGTPKQAIEALQTAVGLDPTGPSLELLGDAWLADGNKKEAMAAWQRAYNFGYRTASILRKQSNTNP